MLLSSSPFNNSADFLPDISPFRKENTTKSMATKMETLDSQNLFSLSDNEVGLEK